MYKPRKLTLSRFLMSIVLVLGVPAEIYSAEHTEETAVPEPFRGFDPSSTLTINYDALTLWLDSTVVDIGRSDRRNAPIGQPSLGTLIAPKVKRATIYEANRFFFEAFEDNEEAQQVLKGIRTSLEEIPTISPLEHYSREEQLAYWLNLYNVTVLSEIVAVYPQRELKKLLVGKNSILSKKILNVANIPLSLNDIQFVILRQNYDNDPLIMYGLYQGIIGSPNIRTTAYSGSNVYDALTSNAIEFVNSNRGTARDKGRGDVLKVSSMYERNSDYFPDFNADLNSHLQKYLEKDERRQVNAATTFKPVVDDWVVTDLYGTYPEIRTGVATNPAALLGSIKSTTPADPAYGPGGVTGAAIGSATDSNLARQMRFRPDVFKYLLVLNMKRLETNRENASVTIEDLGEEEGNAENGDEQE